MMTLRWIQIYLLARNTFVEAVRQKFFHFLLVLALGLLLSAEFLKPFNFGSSELKFIYDFGFGGIWLFGSILAVVTPVQLFFGELEQRTALTLLAKPLERPVFVLGKYVGVVALLGTFLALLVVLLGGVLVLRASALEVESNSINLSGLLVFGLLQWLRLSIVCAVTFAVACFAGSYLYAMIVGFVALLIGQLKFLVSDPAAQSLSLLKAIVWVFPDYQVFNLGEALVLGMNQAPQPLGLLQVGLYGLAYAVLYVGVAIALFRKREL